MIKIVLSLILSLTSCLIFAQEKWTIQDSIKLSKMLDGEIPIYISNTFKKELEQSITGSLVINGDNQLNDFILGVKRKNILMKYSKQDIPNLHIQYYLSLDYTINEKIEYLKVRGLKISSKAYTANPFISIERNTNTSIPLTKKLNFNIYGNYTLDKKHSVILPATSIPYTLGTGFSYNIGKHTVLKSQTNYQYNIIQKRWEWFFGVGVTFTF